MKVSRVFCYSGDIAKQNGNHFSLGSLFLTIIISSIVFAIVEIILFSILGGEATDNLVMIFISTFAFMGFVMAYAFIARRKIATSMSGWAITDDNRIFKVVATNNGRGLYIGGYAVGRMFDQLAGEGRSLGQNIGGAIGAAAQFYTIKKSSEYMSRPEIIANMVESAPNIAGAEVIEILKVYSIIDNQKSFVVNCDYRSLRNNRIRNAKNITIYKAYNQFYDLINVISTHR